jgi:hypothetical protein
MLPALRRQEAPQSLRARSDQLHLVMASRRRFQPRIHTDAPGALATVTSFYAVAIIDMSARGVSHMTNAELLSRAVVQQLQDDGYSVDVATVAHVPARIACRTIFRWQWLATRLHVFVVAFQTAVADVEEAERRADGALEYALSHRGGLPRGVQTGVVSAVVLAADRIDAELRNWAGRTPRPPFAAFRLPIVVDLQTGETIYPRQRGFRGIVYATFLQGLVDRIEAAVRQNGQPAVQRPMMQG